MLSRSDPLRVAVLSTTRAPGIADLVGDPTRGRAFELVAVVVSDPRWQDHATVAAEGVPVIVHDIAAFCANRGVPRRDRDARRAYDATTLELMRPYAPDVVLLCGYLHLLTADLLDRFRDRVANLHDADLTIIDGSGLPRYRGLHATRDAIVAGEPETRTTVHLVTTAPDAGPPLLRSWGFPVHPLVADARRWGAQDVLRAYAYAHREWMMRAVWGRLLRETIAVLHGGALRVRDGRALVDAIPAPFDLEARQILAGSRSGSTTVPPWHGTA